jgi:hypothetical protein
MGKTLKGVRVISARKDVDGKMYPQVCNSPTGKINIFIIREEDLSKALEMGFTKYAYGL